jgi:hypothetical protein
MNNQGFQEELRRFAVEGWKESRLSKYYRSANRLYTTHFIIPPIISQMAPEAFGESDDMPAYWFFVKYKGNLVYTEDIRFRFWGSGDAYMFVRVDGKDVLLAINSNDSNQATYSWWQSNDPKSKQYYLGNQLMVAGDWIDLKAGEPLEMEILFGEWLGGDMSALLLVQVDGVEYPKTRQGGPLLPAFKTEEFTLDQLDAIQTYLPEGECTLTNGPVFRDF